MYSNNGTRHSEKTKQIPTRQRHKLRWFEEPLDADCPVFDKEKGRQFALNAHLRRQGGYKFSL